VKILVDPKPVLFCWAPRWSTRPIRCRAVIFNNPTRPAARLRRIGAAYGAKVDAEARVVPANAGPIIPASLLGESIHHTAKTRRHGVWVPAFAGRLVET